MLKIKRFPHTFVIVFYIILFSAVLTWILPGGEYKEKTILVDGKEKKELVFEKLDHQPQTWQVFSALFKGFVRQSGIIVFILLIGGAFWIMNASKAIDVAILSFLRFTRKLEANRLIRSLGVDHMVMVLIMLLFSIFGAVFGMSEETIAFIIIMVPLAISMGYDSIVGVSLCFIAAGLGFAGAILNPFTIGIAQGIAGLPLFSGIEYRLFCWLMINIAGFSYVLWYARRIKRKPQISPVYEEDEYWRSTAPEKAELLSYHTPRTAWLSYGMVTAGLLAFSIFFPMTRLTIGEPSTGSGFRITAPFLPILTIMFAITAFISLRKSLHFYILNLLGYTILFLIVGVMGYRWYIMEIATLFFAMGIFSGIAMGKSPNEITKLFLDGVKDILSAALIVGLAGGIIVILEDGKVIGSILHGLSQGMKDFGDLATVSIMYLIQTAINLVMPSGSAKAALTMPIMAPFADLIGMSRQAAVMAYQFGDGFTNFLTPVSGVLIGVLGVAKIPYSKWVRWVMPLILILFVLGLILLIPTVTMRLNGF
jgi:uncharacterized ion transporter superfamily protein YfcC